SLTAPFSFYVPKVFQREQNDLSCRTGCVSDRLVATLGALQHVESRPLPIASEQHVHSARAPVRRPRSRKREDIATHMPVREPLRGRMLEHRRAARRAQAPSMHDQHRAQPLAYRLEDKALERFLRIGLDHAMQVEMRLHRELAAPKPR